MKSYLFILGLTIHLFSLPSAFATRLLPLDLEQLSTRAPLIFYGEVLNNQVKIDRQSGRIATFTEFKVIELIKGKTNSTHNIKQIGGHLKERNIKAHVPGVPEFSIGKNYVVFLPEKSRLGFSSPLGLHQGTFTVETINGEKTVSNGSRLARPSTSASRSVQMPLAVDPHHPTRSGLYDFINTVRAYNVR